MAKHTLDDDRPGYYLPEDSQQRLVRLSDHIKFLLRLMRPLADASGGPAREVRMAEVAFCLELLGDQVDLVLDELSGPARHAPQAGAPAHYPAGEAQGYTFGVTLAQMDTLEGLARTLAAHGDVVATGDAAGWAGGTLPAMGSAVFDAAAAVRGVLDAVETQRLAPSAEARSRVEEARAVYAVPARLSADHTPLEAQLPYGDYLH